MKIPLFSTLRRIDQLCLLEHPALWVVRPHWALYYGLSGHCLVCLVAVGLPISLQTGQSLFSYLISILALGGLAAIPWIYFQVRFTPQLRQVLRARIAIYLLIGYTMILSTPLVWAFSAIKILQIRISNMVSVDDLYKDLQIFDKNHYGTLYPLDWDLNSLPERQGRTVSNAELRRLFAKYGISEHAKGDIDSRELRDLRSTIENLLELKGFSASYVDGRAKLKEVEDNFWSISTFFLTYSFCVVIIAMPMALVLRVFQVSSPKSFVATLFLAAIIGVVFDFLKGLVYDRALLCVLLILSLGGLCACIGVSRLSRNNIIFMVGMNIFTLLLMWVPLMIVWLGLGERIGYVSEKISEREMFSVLCGGAALMLALTPWIHRRYLELLAKPS